MTRFVPPGLCILDGASQSLELMQFSIACLEDNLHTAVKMLKELNEHELGRAMLLAANRSVGEHRILAHLLDVKKVDINFQCPEDNMMTALQAAALSRQAEDPHSVTRFLLGRGALKNLPGITSPPIRRSILEAEPFSLDLLRFSVACRENDLDVAMAILEYMTLGCPHSLSRMLLLAARHSVGRHRILRYLLEVKKIDVNYQCLSDGMTTALHAAAASLRLPDRGGAIRFLLDRGADPLLRRRDGRTAKDIWEEDQVWIPPPSRLRNRPYYGNC